MCKFNFVPFPEKIIQQKLYSALVSHVSYLNHLTFHLNQQHKSASVLQAQTQGGIVHVYNLNRNNENPSRMYLAKYLCNSLFTPAKTREQYAKEYEAILDKIKAFGDDDAEGDPNRHVEESYMPDAVFFLYKGKRVGIQYR